MFFKDFFENKAPSYKNPSVFYSSYQDFRFSAFVYNYISRDRKLANHFIHPKLGGCED
jgi:hypothetical protein